MWQVGVGGKKSLNSEDQGEPSLETNNLLVFVYGKDRSFSALFCIL